METLEFALIVLACVIGSAVLCQVVRRASLPLVQIAVGAVVALLVPAVHDVAIPSELFLVLFIAPLLFDEARNTDPRELWENKGSILSLAVGLVLLTVLVVGFVLNWFVPSTPLAAAFACAAALAGAAGLGVLGIAQANAAEDANAAATENVEQRWEGDTSNGEVNAENAGANEDAECNGELREVAAGDLVDGEASGSNEYADVDEAANVNVSTCEDPIELEEHPADEE